MLGYKAAKNGDTRVLIILEIPEDALTNIERTSVKVKETAKYRANKVKVLKIEDSEGKEYETAETGFFDEKKLIYKVGEVLEEPTYDRDIEQVCSRGLHFFLKRKVAEQFGIEKIKDGLLESFYENGQKHYEAVYKGGNLEGLYQSWYENGQKHYEGEYKDDYREGFWQEWYENGQKQFETVYKGGKAEGLYQYWYENGQKSHEGLCKDGKQEGMCQCWFENGQKKWEGMFKNGKLDGMWLGWYTNGQKAYERLYNDGNKVGVWKNWSEEGVLTTEDYGEGSIA